MTETTASAGRPTNAFVRLTMAASRAPFVGGGVLSFVMLGPSVLFGALTAVLLSSAIASARAGDLVLMVADTGDLFPDAPRLAILAGLPPALVGAVTLIGWSRFFRACGGDPRLAHIPYVWFAYGLLIVLLTMSALGMAFPETVAAVLASDGS